MRTGTEQKMFLWKIGEFNCPPTLEALRAASERCGVRDWKWLILISWHSLQNPLKKFSTSSLVWNLPSQSLRFSSFLSVKHNYSLKPNLPESKIIVFQRPWLFLIVHWQSATNTFSNPKMRSFVSKQIVEMRFEDGVGRQIFTCTSICNARVMGCP
jgi:hypothetical protein